MSHVVEPALCQTPANHLVQFYDADPASLTVNVAGFIDEGLRRGDSVVVIATPEHRDAFLSALGSSRGQRDLRARRLVFLDADATLAQFMMGGQPDWRRFETVVGGTIRGLRRAKPDAGLRAYGEMVGLLWSRGAVDAAVQLEKFWNVLLGSNEFTLFCGYPIDVFAENFHPEALHDVLCTHTHVVPGGNSSHMEGALERALSEVFGNEAEAVRRGAASAPNAAWGVLPNVEATILWLRRHQPAYASEVLTRARSYYGASAGALSG